MGNRNGRRDRDEDLIFSKRKYGDPFFKSGSQELLQGQECRGDGKSGSIPTVLDDQSG